MTEKDSIAKTNDDSAETFFGGCPECHSHDGYLNFGRDHWFYCKEHKTKWCFGSNIFSDHRYELPHNWEANRKLLDAYREVAPWHPEVGHRKETEEDIVLATSGNREWAVVSLSGGSRQEGCPMVVYSELESREAAEAARRQAIDEACVYGPLGLPPSHFNNIGRVVAELRSSGVEGDLHALAARLTDAVNRHSMPQDLDDDFPL